MATPPGGWRSVASVAELVAGGALFTLIALFAIFSHALQTHDPAATDLTMRLQQAGSAGHLLGTDHMGRDIWSRLVAGLQWSMACAFTANLLNLSIGTALGLLAAERAGPARTVARQLTDTFQAFPSLIAAIVVGIVAAADPELGDVDARLRALR